MARRNPSVPLHDVADVEAYCRGFLSTWQGRNKPLGSDYDDALGELLLACVELAEKYNPAIGTFRGYLSSRLPGRMVDWLRRTKGDSRNKTRPEFLPLDERDLELEVDPHDFVSQIVEADTIAEDLSKLPQWAKDDVDEIVAPHARGESLDEIAVRLGVSRRNIAARLEAVRNAYIGVSLGLADDPVFESTGATTDEIVEALHALPIDEAGS